MDIEVKIDQRFNKTKIVIYANEVNSELTNIIDEISCINQKNIKAYKDGKMYILRQEQIETIYSERGNIYARSNNEIYKDEFKPKTSKKTIKNTEWFYNNQNTQNSQNDVKKQKKIEKIEKELYEWKQLLDSGEIDEEIYNAETNRLIEKERRINERGK